MMARKILRFLRDNKSSHLLGSFLFLLGKLVARTRSMLEKLMLILTVAMKFLKPPLTIIFRS